MDQYIIVGGEYFKNIKLSIYKYGIKFNNFVVSQILRIASYKKYVLDLASGRGGHIFIYNGYNVKNILFIDNDKEALEELMRRTAMLDNKKLYLYNKRPKKNMNITVLHQNLTDNYRKILDNIDIHKFDVISIMFAIHYLIYNKQSLDNFYNIINSLLNIGGYIVITCFNGKKIFDLLSDIKTGKTWDYVIDDTIKYSIKKLYNSDIFTNFGQKIGVMHGFSKGEYYTENLVNIENLINKFSNFEVIQNSSFEDWLPKYKKYNFTAYNNMDKGDIYYDSLYQYITLRKIS